MSVLLRNSAVDRSRGRVVADAAQVSASYAVDDRDWRFWMIRWQILWFGAVLDAVIASVVGDFLGLAREVPLDEPRVAGAVGLAAIMCGVIAILQASESDPCLLLRKSR
jgi:hypothetical protein